MRKLVVVVVAVVIEMACGGSAKKPAPVTIENRPAAREAGVLGSSLLAGCGGGYSYGGDLYGGGMYGGSTYGCWSSGAFGILTGTGEITSGFDDTSIYGGLLGNEAGEMSGGFGTGEGGGGTGWGTIGTGRYGTIGQGSGTGSGYGTGGGRGGMSGRAHDVPSVKIGQPSATGDLDKAMIRRYVKRNIQKITYCYEKELVADDTLQGTVKAEFTISPDGAVTSSTASGVHADVASCVAQVIEAIEFPKPKGGGAVHVSYPFTFRPDSD
jgi:hypothetical protein